MRKVAMILLGAALCLIATGLIPSSAQEEVGLFKTEDYVYATLEEYEKATGKMITNFGESPMLRIKVAAGELPPVEERISAEPMVIKPVEKIGRYGGMLHTQTAGVQCARDAYFMRKTSLFRLNLAANKVLPWIAEGYEYSEDGMTLTIYLRKGAKWSDGYPFTVDDILFTWEDIILNDELTPIKPEFWMPGGKIAKFEKVDDYTLRIHFAEPYYLAIMGLAHYLGKQSSAYDPKHYLKKWHIKYNPKANELAKEEGYDHWWQALEFHRRAYAGVNDVNLPHMGPWKVEKRVPGADVFVRNPYYFVIDTAGNQLPYIDRILRSIVTDSETQKMKVIAGEIDYQSPCYNALSDYPLFKENEESGGYRTVLARTSLMAAPGFTFNLNCRDPVKRKIYQDVRFRRAMSLAINRDEINKVLFFGRARPRALTALPSYSFYKKEWEKAWAWYSPEDANRLLDEMGLDKRDKEGYRLRPDGKRLSIIIEIIPGMQAWMEVAEMVKEYWESVGVKTSIKTVERSLYAKRGETGERDVGVWDNAQLESIMVLFGFAGIGLNDIPLWYQWKVTKGKQGEEPPEYVKMYYKWMDEARKLPLGSPKYIELMQKIFDSNAENVWQIGTVGLVPKPFIISKKLQNVPVKEGILWSEWDSMFSQPYLHEQWLFEE